MAKIPTEEKVSHPFQSGLRILAIDSDPTVLENIKQMCIGCNYQVSTYSHALHALNDVQKGKDCIDVILTNIYMPNMDGYEILQRIRKAIDVPVIVMSSDDAKSTRIKAIEHGACHYWEKPLHEDHFRNMWEHVTRKAWNQNKLHHKFGSLEDDDDRKKRKNDDSVIVATGGVVKDQNRSSSKESGVDEANDYYPPPAKKPRLVWTDELHQKFVTAVMHLGPEAVPKKILEVMNDPRLTRENVASHLQKYRHQLKTQSNGMTQQQNGMPFVRGITKSRVVASERFDFEALAATSHNDHPYEGLAVEAIHPQFTSNLMPTENQWPNHSHAEQGVTYAHPLAQWPPPNIADAIRTLDEESTRYGVWPLSNTVGIENLSIQNNNVLMDQQRQESLVHQQIHPINSVSVTQNISFGLLLPQSNNALGGVQFPGATSSLYQESLKNHGYDGKET